MLKGKKIGFIGGGKMASALIKGIVSRNLIAAGRITVSDTVKEQLKYLKDTYGVCVTNDNKKNIRDSDIIILAVKPQNMAEMLEGISGSLDKDKLIISIAAGISTGFIEEYFKKGARVIRVMPNTPALIGEGAAAIARGSYATDEDFSFARHIFEAVGISVAVKEELMDAVTGLSGSGPAYGFVIIDALADAGVNMGLGREIALKLAAQTLLGAAKLCLKGDKHPAELRDMVTSPGGTTIAGLQAIEEGKLRATMMAAVQAATLRAKELGRKK
ncbi:MAG TPA: pyrroline-5-carboxylate reductase [Syntrophales bacterium]|nr:pyrroline-5-carboxylate reductase [Syntrophales bacterium]